MKRILLAIIAVFFGTANATNQNLIEFSTSMDFEEFKVVIKNLSISDKYLADEIDKNINKFKKSTSPGQSKKIKFKTISGYMILEREDDYTFAVFIFTNQETNSKINTAYEKSTIELGI